MIADIQNRLSDLDFEGHRRGNMPVALAGISSGCRRRRDLLIKESVVAPAVLAYWQEGTGAEE